MREKIKIATVWLDGCSGCHMSFLDIDHSLLELAARIELVYSPLVDNKVFPDLVDVTLIEGAVSSEEDLEKIRHIRRHTTTLIALGDCAVTGNVPAMRNFFPVTEIIERAYFENATHQQSTPNEVIPPLLPQVLPVHQVVEVDLHLPGCPPPAPVILHVLNELLEGRTPNLGDLSHFG